MKLTWIGHSCYRIDRGDYAVIIDPYDDGSVPGLAAVQETANLVLCSHDHGDHNAVDAVEIEASSEEPFEITVIDTYHDDVKGAKRGPNKIHILDDGETKIVHLGDLGCELEPEQIEQIKDADVMLIPIDGFFTIGAEQAAELIRETQPRIVIPMHYRDDLMGFGNDVQDTVEAFMDQMEDITILPASEIDTAEDLTTQVVVLRPRNATADL